MWFPSLVFYGAFVSKVIVLSWFLRYCQTFFIKIRKRNSHYKQNEKCYPFIHYDNFNEDNE